MTIPFKDVSVLSTERLKALQACEVVDSVIVALNAETDKCPILHFAFTKCIEAMPLKDINQHIFKRILPIMQKMFAMSISSNGGQRWTTKNTTELSTYIQLISTLLTNVTALIKRQTESIQFTRLADLPMTCMQFLRQIFDDICTGDGTELQSLMKCAANALNLLLVLFTSDKLSINPSQEHLEYMEQILLNVSSLAKTQSDTSDVKLMADTWKCFMTLIAKYAKCLPNSYVPSLEWFDRAVEVICAYLQNIMNRLRQGSMDEKHSKLAIFFAKILHKIFNDLSTQLHRSKSHSHLIGLLRTFSEIKIRHSGDNLISSLNELLLGTLRFVVGHDATADLLLSGSSEGNSIVCIETVMLLLKTSAHDQLYLGRVEARNLVHHLVFTCGAEESTFLNSNGQMYEKLVFHMAALMISKAGNRSTSIVLERMLAAAIVQENIYVGYLALEVWNLYSRHFPTGKHLRNYKYWCKLNMQRSSLSRSVSSGLIKSLLRILFVSMPPMLQKRIVNQLRSTDCAGILAIGWHQISKCDPNIARALFQSINHDISKYLAQLNTCKNVENYYQLAQSLRCASAGIGFTEQTIDRTLTLKLEKILTRCQIEVHIDLFTAIAEYTAAGNQKCSIANEESIPATIASAIRVKCLETALRHSNTGSEHLVQSSLEELLKRHNETNDVMEKMAMFRVMCQLNGANVRNDQRMSIANRLKSIKQKQHSNMINIELESQYHKKARSHILLHNCGKPSTDKECKSKSNKDFQDTLDAMEIQAKILEKMYQSGRIDCQSYSTQIDRIINCLKLFKNNNGKTA